MVDRVKLCVIGLGYVGLPLAIEFSKKLLVVGFDTDEEKILNLKKGCLHGIEQFEIGNIRFTSNEADIAECNFYIVTVPTPINQDKTPDLSHICESCYCLGRHLSKGATIVFESTVYPGTTEEVCIPILEHISNLKCGMDFKIGYSPERINVGDDKHKVHNTAKIISAIDDESINHIESVYALIIDKTLLHRAKNIKTAESVKIVENCQRDVNIAFMNEMSLVLSKMHVNINEVIELAKTKWNFIPFYPGLVGGHCIGVDPYYLIHKAKEIGFECELLTCCRRINENMSSVIVENLLKLMIVNKISIHSSKILVLGYSFKENCPDIRNTKVEDIINLLEKYGIEPVVYDPLVNKTEAKKLYNRTLQNFQDTCDANIIILAVPHDIFISKAYKYNAVFFNKNNHSLRIIIDIRGKLNKERMESLGRKYWKL